MQITTIGLDLAKHVFQVHGVDALGDGIEKRRLRRGQVLAYFGKLAPCLVGMEACATAKSGHASSAGSGTMCDFCLRNT
jgi:transposase